MKKTTQTRKEQDSLGTVQVPENAYFGAFTVRAKENFQISGITSPEIFQKALGIVKLAAASTNIELGLINKKEGMALKQACTEFAEGKFTSEFDLDVFQAGAGTSYNMNANEIIANRANELIGEGKGKYTFIHPNNHVNMAQSTNDVIPTATRISILLSLPALLSEIEKLEQELNKKTKQYSNLVKVGRTHLQDAVPITFGQEFDAYKEALTKSKKFIIQQSKELKILGIGGTALGTGINTDPQYRPLIIKKLSEIIKIKFKSANNLTESANNMNSFMNFSAALRSLATNLLNLSEDLKLMNMGPKAGLGEIDLPAVQPGSSIMPGKINPSIPECIDMVSMQVAGNDKVIELAAQKSHFELNVYCPIIMHNILQSMTILTNGTKTIREKAIKNLRINEKKVQEDFDNSLVLATTLAPYIGYPKTAEIVKESLKKGTSLKEEILNKKLYNKKELSELLSVKKTTQPTKIDKRFIKKAS